MSKHYKAKKKNLFYKMDKKNHQISLIKPASACHTILIAPRTKLEQAKKTNGSKLKDFFYPNLNPNPSPEHRDMDQKQGAKPLIFKKNQKDLKVIPLKVKTSDTGHIRHFTPAAQE